MKPMLEVRDLVKEYPGRRGLRGRAPALRAVDGISFDIARGRTLGLVGESGSGKSTAARAILRLHEPTAGTVRLDGTDVTALTPAELRRFRARMQIVFQDPYASLNPRMTVGRAVAESLEVNRIATEAGRRARVAELFDLVGLDRRHLDARPHALSGGQRQRVGIARALASGPDLLVADEAISALDVSVQAQIVNLLVGLSAELGLTVLFISHDLAMVRHLSDDLAVLYLGRLVESGPTELITAAPLHPYTLALLSASPVPDPAVEAHRERIVLRGDLPDPANPPSGCRFRTRCPFATDRCAVEDPAPRFIDGRTVACHHLDRVVAARDDVLDLGGRGPAGRAGWRIEG
ncbi:ABC transporter ATP-binding protein [Agromyces silvae]|uniref:ABC transporter ATP-binding protein n=1 Tax=Agromyces silvae TaxID=3388266 RepID=UPI00280A5EA0|nr:oligopeptide/dipeptide ABC transporter ATP-binding protein [Agromyces protaetiae]